MSSEIHRGCTRASLVERLRMRCPEIEEAISPETPQTLTGTPPVKATIHVSETLHGHKLVVLANGPPTGKVHVSYTASYRKRTIALATKTTTLKHGRLTTTFNLSPRAAKHATICVTATLDNGPTASSTLRRRTQHLKSKPS